jgi:hypothetical protein
LVAVIDGAKNGARVKNPDCLLTGAAAVDATTGSRTGSNRAIAGLAAPVSNRKAGTIKVQMDRNDMSAILRLVRGEADCFMTGVSFNCRSGTSAGM